MPSLWLSKRDFVQVNAFKSVFKQNLRLGFTKELAFAGAIEVTSDKAFKKADPELIKKYLEKYGKKRTTSVYRTNATSY